MDLIRIWQKTPSELSAEERVSFGAGSTSRSESTPVQSVASSSQTQWPRFDKLGNLFLGQGIAIQSLPQRVPDSMYARRAGQKIEGTFNRAGRMIPLASEEDVGKAIAELSGRPGEPFKVWQVPYMAYYRIRDSPVVASMLRGFDVDGNMCMTALYP